jgi:uncharacterized protein YcfL
MKQYIALILTLIMMVSCVTPSQTFLANKHSANGKEIKMIQEKKSVSPYSPYFELKNLVEFTSKGITDENYDSLRCVYDDLQNRENKSNCVAYDVLYSYNNDTITQRVYFINNRTVRVTHDNDVIIKMNRQVRCNLYRFNVNKN